MEKKPMLNVSPESVGIPGSAVERYVTTLLSERIALHSVLVIRRSKIVFEGYFAPMGKDFRHRLYSCSKSFVSCAVGLLVEKGLLSLTDKAVSFFPDKAPAEMSEYLREMTIRDLLTMSTCYSAGASYRPQDPDWEATFFTAPVDHRAGLNYDYCTTATTMLCMIIKRLTGKEFTQVLRPVFDEIGISEDLFCVETPCGHEWGGSGVMATAREFAKFADLCMHYGKYEGKQLLPEAYMREATRPQVDNSVDATSLDEGTGYGYQFWPMRRGFAMRGMGCQFAICLPEEDLLVITTGYEEIRKKGTVEIFSSFWRDLVPSLSDEPLPEDPESDARLAKLAESLTLVLPEGEIESPRMEEISGKTYIMEENAPGWKWIRFAFDRANAEGVLHYENATGVHALPFGLGKHIFAPFPETHYNGRRIGTPKGSGMDGLYSAAWPLPDRLMIKCQIVDISLGTLHMAFGFDGEHVSMRTTMHCEFFMQEYAGKASGTLKK